MSDIEFDFRELEQYASRINEQATAEKVKHKLIAETNRLAGRALRNIKKETPVGQYDNTSDDEGEKGNARVGGTLKRSWKVKPAQYKSYEIEAEVFNNTPYAMYVEYGHKQTPGRFVPALGKRLKRRWVDGQFFMKRAVDKTIKEDLPITEKRVVDWLEEVFKSD